VVYPPYRVLKAVTQRIIYGNWYAKGHVWIHREFDTWLLARLDQLIDGCLLAEPRTWTYVKKLMLGGNVKSLLDCGANIGGYSVVLGKKISVVAVEPMPDTYKILVTNISINSSRVKALRMAVYDDSAETVKLRRSPLHSGADSISDDGGIIAHTITLDDLQNRFGRFDLVKIDVEGVEDRVLRGLTANIPKYLVIEVRPRTWIYVKKWLRDHKYKVLRVEKLVKSNAWNIIAQQCL